MTDASDMPRAGPRQPLEEGSAQSDPDALRSALDARAQIDDARSRPLASIEEHVAGDTQRAAAAADVQDGRAGEDTRRRGWFWHWNNVITQYAPLLGLKGVGLLNSYTVWTDRREESPHRGYAFPSQQAEAGFYGEERAELITINKILIALDLIEIRKEMLPRTDSQGRRWKVPHNLYRVKDRPEGIGLRAADVLRVVELAERDDDVYRYIRRLFSSRFAPIDRDNVWHAILDELADDPRWQNMQTRTAQREARASARTRAGHETRAGRGTNGDASVVLTDGQIRDHSVVVSEQSCVSAALQVTSVAVGNRALDVDETSVVKSNNGSTLVVAPVNEGMGTDALGFVAASNPAPASAVGQSNTTYDQRDSTTTTTTTGGLVTCDGGTHGSTVAPSGNPTRCTSDANVAGNAPVDDVHPGNTSLKLDVGIDFAPGTPPHYPAQTDQPADLSAASSTQHAAATLTVQHQAPSSERLSLDERATSADATRSVPAAGPEHRRAVDPPGGADADRHLDQPDGCGPLGDPSPLVVSLFEAANDRRVTPLERLLLAELERDADPGARAGGCNGSELIAAAIREAVSSGSTFVAPKRLQEIIARWIDAGGGPLAPRGGSAPAGPPAEQRDQSVGRSPLGSAAVAEPDALDAAVVRLPGGRGGTSVWKAVLDDLSSVLGSDAFERLLAGSAIVRYRQGCVEVRVASVAAAEKLSAEYHDLVARRLNERLTRPVDLRFTAAADAPVEHSARPAPVPEPESSVAIIVVSRADADAGRQFWRSILHEIGPSLSPDERERLTDIVPLAQDAAGRLLLGAPTRHVARMLDHRYRAEIERACTRLLGHPSRIHPLDPNAWSLAPI